MNNTEFIRSERMKDSSIKLNNVHIDASLKYFEKEQEKGDSWRDMTTSKMISIMEQEIEEFRGIWELGKGKGYSIENLYEEILDIINTAKMVGALLKENEK